jgi:hypothetical protein
MKRTRLRRRARLRAKTQLRRSKPLERTPSMAASDAQRAAVAGRPCIVCGTNSRIDPAHLIPRSLGGCGDARCVCPLCRRCHRAYDRDKLDLLPYLEPASRAQLAHAVGHVGLIGALRRIGTRRSAAAILAERAPAGGVSLAAVNHRQQDTSSTAAPGREDFWARNERIRQAQLRSDGQRPMGELLEEGVRLSQFASELASAPRRER